MLTKLYVKVATAMQSDEGATALEYAILVALIALAIVAGVRTFGSAVSSYFSTLAGRVGTTW